MMTLDHSHTYAPQNPSGYALEQNPVYEALPDAVKDEIRKLGWSDAVFSQRMLEAIRHACAVDCRLVDDPHPDNPHDLADMMELTHEESCGRQRPGYWQRHVEESRCHPHDMQMAH